MKRGKPVLAVRLLGQFDVRRDGAPVAISARAAQSLLAYLLLTAGTLHRREKLAGLLWADTTNENARKNLRHELWRLRRAIETKTPRKNTVPYLLVDEISIGFNVDSAHWLDVAEVQQPLTEPVSAEALIETLSLYQGELLPGLYDEWVVLERERVRAGFEQKMARLLDLLVEGKRWDAVLEWGERWIALGQTREPAYRALMQSYSAKGDQAKVALTYQRCVTALREDLGVDPSPATQGLFDQLSKGKRPGALAESPAPAAQASAAGPRERATNLPVPLTSFIGRGREIERAKQLLASTRLLSLVGAGGIGKTRLAIQLARELSSQFDDQVWWVDLVALADPGFVPQAVAKTLGVLPAPDAPLIETLVNALCSKPALLVLDNCEHLVAACAQLAGSLLSKCASLKILTTSREALGIAGETLWRVPSLSLPDPGRLESVIDLERYESIQLLVERARAVQPGFALTEKNALPVTKICERLDGIPLAIELAAARVGVLAVHQIAERLDNRFVLLTHGSRTALPRQQTLRATIDWSYDLLSEPEAILFRRLSAFMGSWTLPAAEFVCTGEGIDQGPVLDGLSRLVDKSLVVVEAENDESRYRMLETIRQYADAKLAEVKEVAAVHGRHLEFFVQLAEQAEPQLYGAEQIKWFNRLETERGNLQEALEWAVENGKADAALRIASALLVFWFFRGPYREGLERLRAILAHPQAAERTLVRAKALNALGIAYWADIHATDTRAQLEEALSIGVELGDKPSIARSLRFLGLIANLHADYKGARAFLEQSIAIGRELGPAGRFNNGEVLVFLAEVAANEGDAVRARALLEESLALLRETEDRNVVAYNLRRLAQLAWHQGDFENANAFCRESLILNSQIGDRRGVTACLAGFGGIAVARGQALRAARLLGAVQTSLDTIGIRLLPADGVEYDRNVATLHAQMQARALDAAWAEGRALTLDQAVAYALEEPKI